ncbi:MAG: TRAP transporter substrate-binding protein [Pseudomonadota bacterium]
MLRALRLAGLALLLAGPALAQTGPVMPLRVTGHFAANQKHIDIERAFFGGLAAETGINLQISYNPMDQVGVQAADALRHLRAGAFDVMSVVIGPVARDEPFFDGIDLIGVSPTVAELRSAVDAARTAFDARLLERFGARAMALWPFGPQYFFCNAPIRSVTDLRGMRVRSYTPSMTALLTHLGASPVSLQFSEVYPALQRGLVQCGITSAVSAHAGNWGEVITHVLPLSLAGGIQGHFMSAQAWRRFNPEQQAALTRAFNRLDRELWQLAEVSDAQSLACLRGASECEGRRFNATIVAVPPEDEARVRDAVSTAVLPGFRDGCNRVWTECAQVWNRTVGTARGYVIP